MNNDCITHTLTFLPVSSLLSCLLVNTTFNTLSKNNLIWKPLFQPLFQKSFPLINCTNNFYTNYKKYYKLNRFLIKYNHNNLKVIINDNELYLSGNNLSIIPKTIYHLQSLKILSLSMNNLTVIPDEIGQLTNLTHLFLYSNKLQIIPNTIGQLTSLVGLYLNNNLLELLPDTIGNLTCLLFLDIHMNPLKKIPNTIKGCSSQIQIHMDKSQEFLVNENMKGKILFN